MTEVVVEHDGDRETYSADIVVASCGAANSAKLLLASANDAHQGAGQRLRPGRPQLHVPQQPGRARAVEEPNPTVFQKTLGLNDFYFASDGLRLSARQHPDGRQVAGPDVPRREAARDEAGAEWTLEKIAEHAVDFWLSTEDLPRLGEPRHARADGAIR